MITAAQGKGYFRKRGFIEPLPRRWGVCVAIILGVTLGFKASAALPLEQLSLPAGFQISIYAEVENPRQLALDDQGVLYAGSRRAGRVHAIWDQDHDGFAETVKVIASDLTMPSGIAIKDNQLYIAAVDTIYRTGPLDEVLLKPVTLSPVFTQLPKDKHHGWKFIDFGPDGLLYIPVGAPCNICLSDNSVYASIQTLDLSVTPKALKAFAHGVRNSVGFTWHPETQALWFTDNGRDHLGDDSPACELNIASTRGLHFGYPYRHGLDVIDPEFGARTPDRVLTPPALALGPHVAPLGVAFATGAQFPAPYQNQLFIAEHGSWNRTADAGYTGHRITIARGQSDDLRAETFIEGWLQNNQAWGRPADLLFHPDGSLLIADDLANVIYRVTFEAKVAAVGQALPMPAS